MQRCVIVAVLIALSGCSTMSVISTNPPGAKVYIKSGFQDAPGPIERMRYAGLSPAKVRLTDGTGLDAKYSVRLEREGYKTAMYSLDKHIDAGMLVMDLLLFVPTVGIGSGYMCAFNCMRHSEEYEFILEPEPAPAAPPPIHP